MPEKIKELITKPEINFWIPIIITLVSIAVAWSTGMARLDRVCDRVDTLEKRVESHIVLAEQVWDERDDQYTQIQVTLAEIQKELIYLNEKLAR